METSRLARRCAYCAAGVAFVAGSCKLASIAREQWKQVWKKERVQKPSDAMKIEQLAVLVKSSNVNLRRSAEQLLLERVMSSKATLNHLLNNWCFCGNEEEVMKACTVVCVLVKSVDIKSLEFLKKFLVTSGNILVQTMDPEKYYKKLSPDVTVRQKTQKLALCTVFEMICDFTEPKELLCEHVPQMIPCLLQLLEETQNREIMRYALFTTHQLALNKDLRETLMEHDAVRRVALTVVTHQGDPVLQRVSLQVLVIFATTCTDSKVVLTSMAKEDIIIPTVVCLKCDELECVYWAVALLHEFAVNDVCKEEILSVPGLSRSLSKCLTASEASQQRLILKLLCFLGLQNDGFKSEVIETADIINRLPVCMASSDKEVVHWALVLTHDLALMGTKYQDLLQTRQTLWPLSYGSHMKSANQISGSIATTESLSRLYKGKSAVSRLMNACSSIVQGLVNLTNSLDGPGLRILAETLSCFSSNEHKLMSVTEQGILNTISLFAASGEPDLQYWASAVLLNMAMTSDDIKLEILKAGGLAILNELVTAERENTQISIMAAKTLTMLGFIDKPLSLFMECNTDLGRIEVADTTYHLDKNGLNILMWDKLTSQAVLQVDYSVKNAWEINYLDIKIPLKPQDEGNVVVIVIRGPLGQTYLRALKDLIIFSENVDCDKSSRLDIQPDCVSVLIGTIMSSGMIEIVHMEKSPRVHAEFQFPYGEVVNHCVSEVVLMSAIKILFSTPPDSPISKVAELELLHILARHSGHKEEMLQCDGFIEYLGSVIMQFVELVVGGNDIQPIFVAHCLGALRILAVLSVHDTCRQQLFAKNIVSAIISLLFYLTGEWINCILKNAAISQEYLASTLNMESQLADVMSDKLDVFTLSDCESSDEEDMELPPMSPLPEPPSVKHHLELARTPSPSRHIHKEMSESAFMDPVNPELAESQQPKSGDFEEMFSSLARYGVQTVANCCGLSSTGFDQVACVNLIQSGAVHMMWSSLLCCNTVLKTTIALPISSTLTRLACPLLRQTKSESDVCLSVRDKTSAILVCSDLLEVRNDTWTFESVRCSHGVCCSEEAGSGIEGWYYEATLKSGGIIQIGWATQHCKFEPEKGLGVGDNKFSCAFDGGRCKMWNGRVTELENNDYGMEWKEGDIVSCLLAKNGDMSFWLKGVNMGVAFKAMDTSSVWYPAVSLSTDQQIRFNFGNTNFRFTMPDGYVPVNNLLNNKTESTPPPEGMMQLRDYLCGLVEDEGEVHPQPSLYYEIDMSRDVQKPLFYGFSTMPGWKGEPQQVCCIIGDNMLELPNGHKMAVETGALAPYTFGCGLVMPEGAVFFTVDGRPLKTMYAFPQQDSGQDPLIPYTNNPHVNINFGADFFMYHHGNKRENRLSMAALLHDYHDMRCSGRNSGDIAPEKQSIV